MLILADKIMVHPGRTIIDKGAVQVERGRIVAVGRADLLVRHHPVRGIIDCGRSVLLPGLVNVHTHLELPALADHVRAPTYALWVMNLIRLKRQLTVRDYRTAAEQNVASLIRTGTTTVGEICTHEVSPAVIARSGLRAVIYHELIAMRPGVRLSSLLPKGLRSSRLVHQGLSPHSPHTVSETIIRQVGALARRRALPLCMHVAEPREERELLQGKKSGLDALFQAAGWSREWAPRDRSSISYLERTGILDDRFLAVHAVQADSRDIRTLRDRGAAVAHCPRSNHAMQAGIMQLHQMLDQRIPVGLGTDSLASVPTLSLWDEMRFALRVHRRTGVTARDLLQLATSGGAQALGMEDTIGSIEPGKQADLTAVPLPKRDARDLYSGLLRETESCIMTMVSGKVLYHRQ